MNAQGRQGHPWYLGDQTDSLVEGPCRLPTERLVSSLGPPAQHPRTHFSKSGKYMHHSTFKILFKGIVSSISAYLLYMQHYKIYLCANLRNAHSGNILDDVKTAFEMMVRERSSRGLGRQRTPLFSLFSFAPRQ